MKRIALIIFFAISLSTIKAQTFISGGLSLSAINGMSSPLSFCGYNIGVEKRHHRFSIGANFNYEYFESTTRNGIIQYLAPHNLVSRFNFKTNIRTAIIGSFDDVAIYIGAAPGISLKQDYEKFFYSGSFQVLSGLCFKLTPSSSITFEAAIGEPYMAYVGFSHTISK